MSDHSANLNTASEGRIYTAEDYDYKFPDHWILDESNAWTIMHHAYVDRVVELVKDSGARRVIEVGCGDGWNCGRLAKAGLDVVGTDWSQNGIDHARRLVPDGDFFCGDVKDEKFTERFKEPFDAAIFVEVIEHIPPDDCVGALRNLRDLVRKNGRIVLTTPSTNVPNNNPSHYRHFTKDSLLDLIDETGDLKLVDIEGYGDVEAERRHWSKARWVKNRYLTIHPILDRLNERYRPYCRKTPLERCHGFIVTLERM